MSVPRRLSIPRRKPALRRIPVLRRLRIPIPRRLRIPIPRRLRIIRSTKETEDIHSKEETRSEATTSKIKPGIPTSKSKFINQ
jgi:hypothetical protein